MKRHDPPEDTSRVIAFALAFFGAAAGLAWAGGVFSLLSGEELAALAIFAAGFALLTYVEDRGVRAAVNRAISAVLRRSSRRDRTPRRPLHIRT